MTAGEEELETRRTGQIAAAVLAALVVIGGVLFHWASQPAPAITAAGFDLSHIDAPASPPIAAPAPTPAPSVAAPAASAPAAVAPITASAPPAPLAAKPTAESDSDIMRKAVGPFDSASARKIGATKSLTPRLAMALLAHPKVLGFFLNNRFLVAGIMSQPAVREHCQNPASMRAYLSDGRSNDGVGRTLDMFSASTQYPGATQTIANSAMTTAFLQDCPSLSQLKSDPKALYVTLLSNSQLSAAINDPKIVDAMRGNPAAGPYLADVQSLQSAMTSGALPSP